MALVSKAFPTFSTLFLTRHVSWRERGEKMISLKNWKTEALAGLTTFFTMSYIIFVNPSILATEGTGMSYSGVLFATVLLSFSMTLLMGLYGKLPYAVAPGMGINAFFTYNLVLGKRIPWPVALGMVFWAGVIFLAISLTPLRESLARALPKNLRSASAVGIGLFLTFIGLKNMDIIVSDPVTFVKLGQLNFMSFAGLASILVIIFFYQKKKAYAFLMGIFFVTLIGLIFGNVTMPAQWFSAPDVSSTLFKLDIMGALKLAFVPAIYI
jgi:AGZA family xanthine/uracil permease-like MFS transporter